MLSLRSFAIENIFLTYSFWEESDNGCYCWLRLERPLVVALRYLLCNGFPFLHIVVEWGKHKERKRSEDFVIKYVYIILLKNEGSILTVIS